MRSLPARMPGNIREMAILRSVGARCGHIFTVIMGEAAALALADGLSIRI